MLSGTGYSISTMKEQIQRIIDNMQAELEKGTANTHTDSDFYRTEGRISAIEDYIKDLRSLISSDPPPAPQPAPSTDYKRHGGPFDRGSADSYYRRGHDPHYYVGATGQSERVKIEPNTPEWDAYMDGYNANEREGTFKYY